MRSEEDAGRAGSVAAFMGIVLAVSLLLLLVVSGASTLPVTAVAVGLIFGVPVVGAGLVRLVGALQQKPEPAWKARMRQQEQPPQLERVPQPEQPELRSSSSSSSPVAVSATSRPTRSPTG